MADRRRYTGTKTLQFGWSLLVVAATIAYAVGSPEPPSDALARPVVLGSVGGAWLLGLLALGWRERRHWRRLVATSNFEPAGGASRADLQRIVKGHSVVVSTTVPDLLAQTHTVLQAGVEGVDASFTIRLRAGDGTDGAGVTTGNPTLDERYHVQGSKDNVELLLSPDVQSALMDVETPGEFVVTGERVTYRVPYTRLSATELSAAADAVAEITERLERIGRGAVSPQD